MSMIHKLFYWNWDGYYILSKSKLFSIIIFIIMGSGYVFTWYFGGGILFSLIISAIAFLIGYAIHFLSGMPSQARLENGDHGLIPDILYLFTSWQDDATGDYRLSKTKLITLIVLVAITVSALAIGAPTYFVALLAGTIVAVPTFAVGKFIHNNSSQNRIGHKPKQQVKTATKQPVKERPKVVKTPEPIKRIKFQKYRIEINRLKSEYVKKESNVRDLIEKKFEPPQMSYDKFMSVINSSTKLFNSQVDEAESLMDLGSEDSKDIEAEIESKIDVLKTLIQKQDDLTNEIVISMSKSKESDEEVHDLLDDMEKLIDSVKDYE